MNYDFRSDLVLANSAGLRIYQQNASAAFEDITSRTGLPSAVLRGNYTGAWAFDVDLDGDLDLILGVPHGEPVVLRNNGDGTFAVIRSFPGLAGVGAFASADLDGDGVPDAAFLDASGTLRVFVNQRFGVYRERSGPPAAGTPCVALVALGGNADGLADLVALGQDGSASRFSLKDGGADWVVEQLAGVESRANGNLLVGDFDNNGSTDILAGGRLLLGTGAKYAEVAVPVGFQLSSAVDWNGDGRLDLIGVDAAGQAVSLLNHGKLNYKWQTLRVRAAKAVGDQRINSFGIGGTVEIRAGLLTQAQIISSPVLHFGLGNFNRTDVARIVWPNGSVQAEFDLKAEETVLAEQRLKGSCPMLFAWDGRRMAFVKDGAPWSPALGLHINAQAVAGIHQTEDWFKVPGESLRERDGIYDLRVTAELWETFYIDHYSLKVVDHPEGTEIYTDERFAVESPPLKIYSVSQPRSFLAATDDHGQDVGRVVADVDGKYLDHFGRGRYQGVTRDHYVELTLPADAPRGANLYLVGTGWMHPTDATVNVAISQGNSPQPEGLRIEVADGRGGWTVGKTGLGFLAGKGKTMVVEIGQLFAPGAPRSLRLRTNLEIYWDQLAWAQGVAEQRTSVVDLPLQSAELRYRGFSAMQSANPSSPEVPDYGVLAGTSQRWRDLEGYYTRHGDVTELLGRVDDRIAIMNAGDELRLQFAALPAPGPGMKRDYVMVGNGWIKDGDYNCVFSDTVLPLPYRGMAEYSRPATNLEKDPAYKLHQEDWEKFHTRYVTPKAFRGALWN